jgi:Mg/Co/Ni transporter MgtE
MAELPELALAYLRQRPESAARTLEELGSEDAAGILLRAPARIAAPVLAAMTTLYAARCVAQMPADVAAARCEELSWPDAASVLRAMEPTARDALLAELPESKARRFRRSLEYGETTIGAWLELDTAAMPAGRSVAEALRLLADIPNYPESHLLLTDASQRHVGAVPLGNLLSSSPSASLETLAVRDMHALRDTASLGSAVGAPDWERSTILPVVNHRGELLGGLTRRTLRRALQSTTDPGHDEPPSIFAHLLKAYLSSGEGLLRLLLQAPRPRTPLQGPGS